MNKKRKKIKSQRRVTPTIRYEQLSIEKTNFSLDKYELQRESTLVTQAGLVTAVFSFSTSALFTVWQVGLAELERIPDIWIHFCIGIITFFLLLSIWAAVKGLYLAINTDDKSENISISDIRKNNNAIVKNIKRAIVYFMIAISLVFLCAITLGVVYYFPVILAQFCQ